LGLSKRAFSVEEIIAPRSVVRIRYSVKTISVILGHSNITTTMNLYVHPDNKEKKRCIERMLKDIL